MIMRLVPLFALMYMFSPLAFAKYTVCTATINSNEEQAVFKAKLNKDQFDFIELTDYSSDPTKKQNDWFKNACEKGVKCDVLVISGHFGGEFFGKSDFSLGLNDLNNYSCYNRCDGIMSHPKEVYLFGCNTLATKAKDARSETTYRDVLIADGVPRVEAERRAAARYGPFGFSFKDQIERSFENVPVIYGFDSVGPSGGHVKPSLARYLDQLGDFKTHLDQLKYPVAENLVWKSSMKDYARAQGAGLSRNSPVYSIKENSCIFTDDKRPLAERLQLVEKLLTVDPNIYLPTVSHFVNRSANQQSALLYANDPAAQAALTQLSRRQDLAKLVSGVADQAKDSPGIEVDLLNLSYNLGWMSKEEFGNRMRSFFAPLLASPTRTTADLVCSLLSDYGHLRVYIQPTALASYKFDKAEQFSILACTHLNTPALAKAAVAGALAMKKLTALDASQIIDAFGHLDGQEEGMLQFMRRAAKFKAGPYQQDFEQDLARFAVSKARGAEQVEALKQYAKTADLGQLTYALSYNNHPEPQSAYLILNALLQVRAGSFNNIFLSPSALFTTQETQEALITALPRMIPELRAAAVGLAGQDRPMPSKALRSYLLSQLQKSVQEDSWEFSEAYHGLGQSDLNPEEIEALQGLYAVAQAAPRVGSLTMQEMVRHALFLQARRGRVPMTGDLRTGRKSYYICQKGPGGSLGCGIKNY